MRLLVLNPNTTATMTDGIAEAVARDRAEVIVLGCAGMAGLCRWLTGEFGLPVVDGVTAAVKLVEGLVGLGLRTSKAGAYAPPLPKTYAGELARFAPPPGGRDAST
ncbi:MAG TPA: aspartate/glutamate racemase family protein [Arenibaculum sp.]|nr:aspartate/glutamate racemase family protein [Arenibaculum sp.]